MAHPDPTTVRCPTCGASQDWSDACRRCKSDLRLLRAVATSYARARRLCLEALRDGRRGEARRLAAHAHWLGADPESRRLMALGALLAGDWADAVALAGDLPGGD